MRIKRAIRFWWQRHTRGWDDSATWNLEITIARFIYPRLLRFKELNDGTPIGLTDQEWDCILDDMIYTMFVYSQYDWDELEVDSERAKRGLKLFSKWFPDLWW